MKLAPEATLTASVNEENIRRESYSAEWQDLILRTLPQDRCCLSEVNRSRRESYNRKQRVSYLVQRAPDQRLWMGLLGQELSEYRLPLPIFTPTQIGGTAERPEAEAALERAQSPGGVCPDKREISAITKDLPPLMQPVSLAGKKPELARRSLSRSMSQEAQRG
ncbi:telethonin-like [Pristis pectinata]|uniref:telethonin-like n=1 Tax=Pristis pectinata TaxID=685728 RepID=UPI00223DA23A|nr:telethonin-like [Pristis pectinata]